MIRLSDIIRNSVRAISLTALLLTYGSYVAKAQDAPSAAKGKELFEQQACFACHAIDRVVIGPALKDITKQKSEEWLIKWIRNNVQLRESGDKDAIAIYKEYNGAAMNTYEHLSDNDIKSILLWIEEESSPKAAPASGGAPDALVQKGKELFEQQACMACHAIDRVVIGPALKDVTKRRSKDWLHSWIKNNVQLRESGDPDAIALYKEYNSAAMNVYENLTTEDIDAILAWIDYESAPKVAEDSGKTKTDDGKSANEGSFYNKTTLYVVAIIAVVLLIVAIILYRIRRKLSNVIKEFEGSEQKEKSLTEHLKNKYSTSRRTINTLLIIVSVGLVLGIYGFYFGVTEVGVQRGYAPTQPIAYSHALHAGELNIDCRYCHSTVDYSKAASIPSLNTCMNCHVGVQLRDKYNGEVSPEIQKIYTALDYNPDAKPGERFGDNPKNIKWVRVHNLPDLSYFNHSQHANVAGLECQKCHGPVQEMEVIQQYATLQMGWCIDCHRNSGVDVENNDYYEKLHALAKKDIEKNGDKSKYLKDGKVNITIANIGGLDCSKCHY
ncbi:MAG: c-type cytochrome [Bacteroidetes bacterium]|nr:c-type cytochrome [Bacteroidota bacterium]